MADEEEGEESPAPESEAPPEDVGEDLGNDTIYMNLYTTKILPPWEDKPDPKENISGRKYRSARDYTVALTDDNAGEFGDTTRVGWKGRVDYFFGEYEEEKKRNFARINDIYRDANRLLEVTISTIIVMASGSGSVPMENYLYTELYLKNIKDGNGDHPPNISNLLKHMRYLKKQYDIKWEEEYKASPPNNLVLAKISKKSKIPVKINRTVNSTTINVTTTTTTTVVNEEAEVDEVKLDEPAAEEEEE